MHRNVFFTIMLIFLNAYLHAQSPTFTPIELPGKISVINVLHVDKTETLWMGTGQGLYEYENTKFVEKLSAQDNENYKVNAIESDSGNNLWLGNYKSSIVHYADGKANVYSFSHLTENKEEPVLSVYLFKNLVYASTSEGTLVQFDQKSKSFVKIETPTTGAIFSLAIEADGKIWLATIDGLFSQEKDEWSLQKFFFQSFDIKQKQDEYWCIGRDNEYRTKLMYLYSYRTDVLKRKKQKWGDLIFHNLPNPHSKLNDLAFDDEGILWLASNDGVYKYDPFTGYSIWYCEARYNDFGLHEAYNIVIQSDVIWVSDNSDNLYRITFQ